MIGGSEPAAGEPHAASHLVHKTIRANRAPEPNVSTWRQRLSQKWPGKLWKHEHEAVTDSDIIEVSSRPKRWLISHGDMGRVLAVDAKAIVVGSRRRRVVRIQTRKSKAARRDASGRMAIAAKAGQWTVEWKATAAISTPTPLHV